MNTENESFVVRIPITEIVKIIEGAKYQESDGDHPVTPTSVLMELSKPWAIVCRDIEGVYFVQGFEDQKTCSIRVGEFYNTEYTVVYVLKNGIPRKNITIEVKARFR
jgi:hypothetical protein